MKTKIIELGTLPLSILEENSLGEKYLPLYAMIGGITYRIKMTSSMEHLDRSCTSCGVIGNVLRVFRKDHYTENHASIQLCYQRDDGKLVLMNTDHIKALADGGSTGNHNTQTMCYDCNIRKSS